MEKENKDYRNHKSFNLLKEIAVVIIIFFIILIPFVKKLELHSLHRDENYWLRSTKCFKLFFIDKDLNNNQWKKHKIEPIGKYIIGLALYIAGHGDRIDELSRMKRWNFRKDYSWNLAHGSVPPKEILYIARLTMALFGSLTCMLIYWIGRMIFCVKAGIIASLLLAYNPLMWFCSRRAMTDAPLLFFLTANIILVIYFYQSLLKQNLLRTFVFAVLIGINIALATGTKLNGGLAGLIFTSFCIFVVVIKSGKYKLSKGNLRKSITEFIIDREIKTVVISLLISGVIATLVFVIMNPSLYHQPLKGSLSMIKFRTSEVSSQQKNVNPKKVLIDSLSTKVDFVVRRTFFLDLLDSLSKKVDLVARRTFFTGRYVILANILKISIDLGLFLLGCVMFFLFLLGLIMLLYHEVKYLIRNSKPSSRSIIIIWTVITFIGITIWIPFDWSRYYLPVIPCIVIVIGFCLDTLIEKSLFLLKRFNFLRTYRFSSK